MRRGSIRRSLGAALLAASVAACGGASYVIINVPATQSSWVSPDQSTPIQLEVSDMRRFNLGGADIREPSIMGVPSPTDDDLDRMVGIAPSAAIDPTSMNVQLGPGDSVADRVEDILAKTLRESGFDVVTEDPGSDPGVRVVPVRVDRFWSWKADGNLYVRIAFGIEGGGTLGCASTHSDDARFEVDFHRRTQRADRSVYIKVIGQAVTRLREEIRSRCMQSR